MQIHRFRKPFVFILTLLICFISFGCGAQTGVSNVNLANSGTSNSNAVSNTSIANSANTNTIKLPVIEAKEPGEYQATVTLKFEAVGDQQKKALPTLIAKVARSGAGRRMEFTMPAGGRIIFLDMGGINYLILPEKKQYAELNRESLGFDVRRMLMPEQIVEQVKNVQGMQLVGEEKYNGRDATRYSYGAGTDTQTRAGQVKTESFMLVDKATGLPLHTEIISQSPNGGNVQGYNGLRVITEIGDIKTEAAPDLFPEPTALGFTKIESEQMRSQVDLVFNSIAALLAQVMKQGQPPASPTVSPAR